MQSELIRTLQKANREISSTVTKLSEANVASVCQTLPPGELRALNGKLARIAARLVRLAPGRPKEPELQSALAEYLANLESLKTVLVGVQDTLSRQRDQLKKNLNHMNSARSWAEAFRASSSA